VDCRKVEEVSDEFSTHFTSKNSKKYGLSYCHVSKSVISCIPTKNHGAGNHTREDSLAAENNRGRFRGGAETTHPINEKGRVSLPAKYRNLLQGDLVAIPMESGDNKEFPSVWLYANADHEVRVEEVLANNGHKPGSEAYNYYQHELYGRAVDISVDDANGRILIPASLRKSASLSTSVKIIGAGDHIEVWDVETYARYMEYFSSRYRVLASDSTGNTEKGVNNDSNNAGSSE